MPKTAMIRARVDPAVKSAAEAILTDLGLTPTDAITLLYHQIIMQQGLPFPVRRAADRGETLSVEEREPSVLPLPRTEG